MNKINLENRVAIVTGGAQGFGLAITKRFIESGARVLIWDKDTEYLNKVDLKNTQKIEVDVSNYNSNNWLDFNSKSIPEIIANNEIVFLDITADWCITCKFNKINVLNSKKVSDFFVSQEVTLIKADWTQPNEKINKFLKKYNKFGIPFNAFYSSKFPEGIIMNEILTEKQIFETYNKVK